MIRLNLQIFRYNRAFKFCDSKRGQIGKINSHTRGERIFKILYFFGVIGVYVLCISRHQIKRKNKCYEH